MIPPADLVLVAHFLFVLFVLIGLLAVWLGAVRGWPWVRNFWFRVIHLGAVLFVAAESLVGAACPLTVWEDWLRGGAPSRTGFIQRWLSRLLYYDFPPWVFTLAYVAFALLVIATLFVVRPRFPRKKRLPH